jgi:hypothetical protein
MFTPDSHPGIIRKIGADKVWIDAFGRGAVSVDVENQLQYDHELFNLRHRFEEKCREASVPFACRVSLAIDGRCLALPSVAATVKNLFTTFGARGSCRLEVHYPSEVIPDIEAIIQFGESLRVLEVSNPVVAYGRLPLATVDQMERMFNAACLAIHAVDELGPRFNDADAETVSTWSNFGFLVPVRFWIGSHSLSTVEEDIPKALWANRAGGFSVPLVSASLLFDPKIHSVPDPTTYSDLLVRLYRTYNSHDNLFAPLVELASAFRTGGSYSIERQTHCSLMFVANQDGQVFRYRQVPCFGVPIGSCDEIAKAEAEHLSLLIENQGLRFLNTMCRTCEWQYLCGGHDAFEESCHPPDFGLDADRVFQVHCHYRTLILEHFAIGLRPLSLAALINSEESLCDMTI